MIKDRRYGLIYIFLALWASFVARQRDLTGAYIVSAVFLVLGILKMLKYRKAQQEEDNGSQQ